MGHILLSLLSFSLSPPFVPSIFLPHPVSLPLFFLQSFFLLKKPGYLSHEGFLHCLWLSMSSRCQLTLSSVPWVSCKLVVAPEAWSDADWIFLARPRHRWWYALLSGGTRDLLSPFMWHWDWSVGLGTVSLIHPLSSSPSVLHPLGFVPTDNHCLGPLIH